MPRFGKNVILSISVLLLFTSTAICFSQQTTQRQPRTTAWISAALEAIAENEKPLIRRLEFEPNSRSFALTADIFNTVPLSIRVLVTLLVIVIMVTLLLFFRQKKNHNNKTEQLITQYQSLFESAGVGHLVVDKAGAIIMLNSRMEEMFGYSKDELIGKKVEELIPEAIRSQHIGYRENFVHQPIKRVMGEGLDLMATKKDGGTFPVEISLNYFYQNKDIRIAALVVDITQRKNAERKLVESEQRFKSLIENSEDALLLTDENLVVQYQSPAVERLTGISLKQRQQNPGVQYTDPDQAELVRNAVAQAIQNPGRSVPFQCRAHHLNGNHIWIEGAVTNLLRDKNVNAIVLNFRDISAKMEAEKILKENTHKISHILESINDGFIGLDSNWCYTYMNEKAGEMTKRNPKTIIGKNVWDEFPEAIGSETYQAFHKAMREQRTIVNIDHFEPLNLWQENHIYPTPEGVSVFIRNVSEQKLAESKMIESEQRLRLVVESAPNAMVLVNHDGKITLVNTQTEKSFGYSREELMGKNVEMLIPQRFNEKHPHYRNSFFVTPKARSMGAGRDLFAMRKDGSEFPVEIGLNPIESPEGHMVLASIIDITERKRAEERFRLVVESAPNAMVLVSQEGKITLVNSQTEKLFGYSRNELINQSVEMLIPQRFKQNHPHFRNMFFSTPKARSMGAGRDLFAMRKDGSEFPVEIGLNPIESAEGHMVLASIIDITERKRAEERFRLVVESAPNAMVLVNKDGKITLVNSQTEKLFGHNRNELINQGIEMLIPKRFKENHPQFLNMFFSTPKARSMGAGRDLFAVRKDGSEFPVEIGLNPIESPEGHMVLASIIDITERKMQEANRLKSDFLANMSHELRTPLNAVLGFSELLIDQKVGPLSAKQLDYLNDIHASGSHLLKLINNVLDLSKIEAGKTELSIETFEIAEVIEGVAKNVKPIADKKNIQVIQTLTAAVKSITLDKNKFRQILYNLVSNAIKFSNDQGIVNISTESGDEDTFILKVSDQGIGIAKDDLKKLFIPFVQLDSGLARQHEGSGLGLALTRNLVALHGGEINVESTLGKGATFSVLLPVTFKQPKHER
jgi:PAS domain S-box-containing protein